MFDNHSCLTSLILSADNVNNVASNVIATKSRLRYRRLLLPACILVLLLQADTRAIVQSVLTDAFLQVSAFVAATLALYYGLTQYFGERNLHRLMQTHPIIELSLAAVLGALPGCGGAIVVITQFTQGKVSFGAVVAVLTATMGDAAFLLLAQQPLNGLTVIAVSLLTGIVSGSLINCIHANDFMRPTTRLNPHSTTSSSSATNFAARQASLSFWKCVFFPALLIAALVALQMDANQFLHLPSGSIEIFGAACGFIAVLLWALSSKGDSYQKVTSEEPRQQKFSWVLKVAQDTQFVTSWVVAAFLLFELSIFWFGLDLTSLFSQVGPWVVLFAVLFGFLPGCGPQIMLTSLYLQGAVPFSAQLGNAISNDGDALFPAIALAPKAAIIATLYSAIPAILVGYGYYFLFEIP